MAQTHAGTSVENVARANFTIDQITHDISSNAAVVRVAEIIDIRLSSHVSRLSIVPAQLAPVPFVLTNDGNGREAFELGATFPDGIVEGFAIDSNGDGIFDPLHDTLLGTDARTQRLSPGQAVALFILVRPNGSAVANLSLTARAVTGWGRQGTVIPGQGDDGTNAIVGATGASATLDFTLVPGSETEAVLDKSQRVTAPDGSDKPVRGAVITYSLIARFTENGLAVGASLSDAIPAGTRYLPGSISLNGTAMTDAGDADAGSFDGGAIHVALGDVPTPAVRTVQFKVIIK